MEEANEWIREVSMQGGTESVRIVHGQGGHQTVERNGRDRKASEYVEFGKEWRTWAE